MRSKLKSKESVAPLYERPDDKLSIKHSDKEKANILQKQFSSVFTIEPDSKLPKFDTRTTSSIPEVNIPAEMAGVDLTPCKPGSCRGSLFFKKIISTLFYFQARILHTLRE